MVGKEGTKGVKGRTQITASKKRTESQLRHLRSQKERKQKPSFCSIASLRRKGKMSKKERDTKVTAKTPRQGSAFDNLNEKLRKELKIT